MFVKTNQWHSIVIPLSSSARFTLMSSNSAECNADISPEIENTRSVPTLSNYFYYYYCLLHSVSVWQVYSSEVTPCYFASPTNCNCDWGTCIAPLLENRGCITESIRILVPVNRIKQKCFQITTKQINRLQQFQLRRQPVPCSLCSNRTGSVAKSSTCPRHDEVATRWGA